MTIKDVEVLTGLPRANIRFYESEGLIDPARSDNGHRDYSEDDVQSLLKIKLLRSLQVSIEEIRALQAGECTLQSVLQEKTLELEQQQEQLQAASQLCRKIQAEGQSYASLDAEKYLSHVEESPAQIKADRLPRVRIPIRRYFARTFDLALCTLMVHLPIVLLARVNVNNFNLLQEVLYNFLALGLMLAAEGLLLAKWGTTPGKWLLGISVTDESGKKLSVADGYERTWQVLYQGMGFGIPIWSQIMQIKSYRKCDAEEDLPWEADNRITLKDKKAFRTLLYIAAYLLLSTAIWAVSHLGAVPLHRGDITTEQFYENYNDLADYYDILTYKKTDNGNWYAESGLEIMLVDDYVQIDCVEENGILQQVTLTGDWLVFYEGEAFLCLQSFITAEHPKYAFTNELALAVDRLDDQLVGESHMTFENYSMDYEQTEEAFILTVTKL